jgi:hypothetical protein
VNEAEQRMRHTEKSPYGAVSPSGLCSVLNDENLISTLAAVQNLTVSTSTFWMYEKG